jgi:tetratricopeptide (TPR) repeat protein
MPATTWPSPPPARPGTRDWRERLLQHQGSLADDRNQLDRATRLYQQALQRFQEAGERSVMRTYNLLGVAEQKAGRLAEARAWYEKSRELAVQLKDQPSLGQPRRTSASSANRKAKPPASAATSPPPGSTSRPPAAPSKKACGSSKPSKQT